MKLVVGTRGSNLALVQTNWVVDQLKKENPGVDFIWSQCVERYQKRAFFQ